MQQSLLMYGSPSTKAKAVKKGRNVEFVRTLVALSDQITDGQWFPNGVGANLMSILTDVFRLDDNLSKEAENVIPLYDVAGQVFYKISSILDARISYVVKEYSDTRGHTVIALKQQEELLVQKLAMAMFTVAHSLQYIHSCDDFDINETSQDNLLTELIDVK
jgi:hypothetical protein